MKIFTKRGIIGKLIIVIILMSIIGCAMPKNISFATTDAGGVLLKPITDFAIGIGDAIINLIHKVLFNMDKALLVLDKTSLGWLWALVAGVVIAAIVAVAVFAIGAVGATALSALGTALISTATTAGAAGAAAGAAGAAAGAAGAAAGAAGAAAGATGATAIAAALAALGPYVVGSMIVTSVATGVKTGAVAGFFVNRNLFGDEEVFPLYRISPEEIFEGKIPMLNVNFFEAEAKDTVDTEKNNSTTDFHEAESNTFYEETMNSAVSQVNTYLGNKGYSKTIEDTKKDGVASYDITTDKWEKDNATYYATVKGRVPSSGGISPGSITVVLYTNGSEGAPALNDTAFTLKPTIAKWYYALRTLAIVVMLLILVYIGIRIMTSSIASEKSKYKNMLVDWVVAFCLIFIMHYIMVFANNINDSLIKIFDSVAESKGFTAIIDDRDESLWKKLNEKDGIQLDPSMKITEKNQETGEEKEVAIEWQTNLMGAFRIWAAQNSKEVEGLVYVGYGLCFLIMVFYTIFFLATYLKRLVYLAFLTIMAPLVAMTYPIDKLNDGKAQAFDMWLKEYIFNLLLQPVHLLLYVVLISSAFELVASNVIYALVAIGFLMPAEKLIRKFFGFEKAQTPGMLANATGAAIAMNTINRLLRPLPPRHKVNRKDYDQYSTEVSDNKGIDNKMLYDGYENTEGSEDKTPVKTVEAKDDSTPPQGNNKSPENTPPVVPANHVIITGDSKRKMEEEEAKRKAAEEEAKRKKEEEEMARKKEEKKRQEYEKAHPIRTNIKRAKNNTKRNIKRAKTITRNYLGNAVQRAYRNYNPAEAIRSMNKVATGALVGAPLSIVAGAAKIASGSSINDSVSAAANTISTAVQFTTKDREPINPDDAKSVGEDFVRSQEDNIEEYKKKIRAQKTNEKIHDRENVQRMQEYLNINDYNEAQQKLEEYRDCFDANIDDIETVATIVKKVEKDGWNKDLAKTTAKAYSSVAKRPSKMSQKEYDDFKSRWKRYVNTQGITDEKQADKAVNEIIRKVENFGVTKDGLKDL